MDKVFSDRTARRQVASDFNLSQKPNLWLLRNFTFYSHLSVRITKDIRKMSFLASAQKEDKKWFISLNICFVNESTKLKGEQL